MHKPDMIGEVIGNACRLSNFGRQLAVFVFDMLDAFFDLANCREVLIYFAAVA